MQYKTHIIGGIGLFGLFLSVVGIFYSLSELFLGVIFVLVGSLFPDIDYHKSKLGKYFFYLNYGVKHRGFLHSFFGLIFIVLLFLFLTQYTAVPLIVLIAFLLGFVSHMLLDALTKKGIRPFYPFKFRIRGPFRTGKIEENLLLGLLLVGIVLLMYF